MHLTRRMLALGLCALLLLGGIADQSAAEEQKPKLDFALRDMNGVAHRLSQYRGKWVVLEWIGFDCEPVNEAYRAPARKLPALQQTWRGKGVVWLSINSNAVGQRGYVEPAKCKAALTKLGANPTALLLDPTGVAGKTFGAQVTPEVRVISPRGDVVYGGGFEGVAAGTTVRYLETVLSAATSGRAIPYAGQSARGCRILYQAAQPAAPVATGPKAQDFRLTDSNGVVRRLSDYRGKWVILEWINFDCPYVQKQYDRSHRSMQKLHARSKRLGIVWLCICSSAPGKQGYMSPAQANARLKLWGASPTAYLHDPSGAVGKAYGASHTPHMRVISPQGTIEFSGGIDSIVSGRAADVPRSKNYVRMALEDIEAKRPLRVRSAQPYGCTVKY